MACKNCGNKIEKTKFIIDGITFCSVECWEAYEESRS